MGTVRNGKKCTCLLKLPGLHAVQNEPVSFSWVWIKLPVIFCNVILNSHAFWENVSERARTVHRSIRGLLLKKKNQITRKVQSNCRLPETNRKCLHEISSINRLGTHLVNSKQYSTEDWRNSVPCASQMSSKQAQRTKWFLCLVRFFYLSPFEYKTNLGELLGSN